MYICNVCIYIYNRFFWLCIYAFNLQPLHLFIQMILNKWSHLHTHTHTCVDLFKNNRLILATVNERKKQLNVQIMISPLFASMLFFLDKITKKCLSLQFAFQVFDLQRRYRPHKTFYGRNLCRNTVSLLLWPTSTLVRYFCTRFGTCGTTQGDADGRLQMSD